jgi:hypothetical protein
MDSFYLDSCITLPTMSDGNTMSLNDDIVYREIPMKLELRAKVNAYCDLMGIPNHEFVESVLMEKLQAINDIYSNRTDCGNPNCRHPDCPHYHF